MVRQRSINNFDTAKSGRIVSSKDKTNCLIYTRNKAARIV
jgi:hypothetical protein